MMVQPLCLPLSDGCSREFEPPNSWSKAGVVVVRAEFVSGLSRPCSIEFAPVC
jgi:hypothetical protein